MKRKQRKRYSDEQSPLIALLDFSEIKKGNKKTIYLTHPEAVAVCHLETRQRLVSIGLESVRLWNPKKFSTNATEPSQPTRIFPIEHFTSSDAPDNEVKNWSDARIHVLSDTYKNSSDQKENFGENRLIQVLRDFSGRLKIINLEKQSSECHTLGFAIADSELINGNQLALVPNRFDEHKPSNQIFLYDTTKENFLSLPPTIIEIADKNINISRLRATPDGKIWIIQSTRNCAAGQNIYVLNVNEKQNPQKELECIQVIQGPLTSINPTIDSDGQLYFYKSVNKNSSTVALSRGLLTPSAALFSCNLTTRALFLEYQTPLPNRLISTVMGICMPNYAWLNFIKSSERQARIISELQRHTLFSPVIATLIGEYTGGTIDEVELPDRGDMLNELESLSRKVAFERCYSSQEQKKDIEESAAALQQLKQNIESKSLDYPTYAACINTCPTLANLLKQDDKSVPSKTHKMIKQFLTQLTKLDPPMPTLFATLGKA